MIKIYSDDPEGKLEIDCKGDFETIITEIILAVDKIEDLLSESINMDKKAITTCLVYGLVSANDEENEVDDDDCE
ncbi:hypothetical protein SAMN04515656_10313 [Eubacterium aggregans]|uniref:Uncharacterized protein n=1 Tax=Eubacterium aggregans TaxID=81409 RepID=A0A1H3Y2V8_9FIRM|nr:hypothetical protein [Eubacterium aggregans]SEA05138.1 hypothetical protein SAMN04515656_10313 [Eubacterium aggregans]